MKKEYTNGEVIITWQPDKCIHSAICVTGLSEVFKPREAPWIKMEAATTSQLIEQVKKCPSGALGFRMNSEKISDAEMRPASMVVEVITNGPYIVKGDIEITHSDGSKELKQSSTALCRCGASNTKPFCDGTHRKIDFAG